MAGWEPSSACIGGILSGLYFSIGELYPWWTNGNPSIGYVSRDPIKIGCGVVVPDAQYGQFATFGDPAPGMHGFIFGDTSKQIHESLIAEFNVKKPEGATYHKQTFCFYLSAQCEEVLYKGTRWVFASISRAKFTRRQYSDATTYTETQIEYWNSGLYAIPNDIISGTANIPARYVWDDMLISFGNINYQNVDQFGVGIWCSGHRGGDSKIGTGFNMFCTRLSTLESAFGGDFVPEQENDPNEDPDDNNDNPWDGGDGDHDDHSDIITDPDEPGAGGASTGFLTLYTGSAAVMRTFAESLWDISAITEIIKYFPDPMQWIVSCLMLPVIPETSGAASPVWGSFTWPVTFSLVSNQYKTVDCGKIGITRYWGNFMDYAPYTKITIWLPYIGYRDLDVDMVMDHILHLKYIVDVLTGDCTAILSIDAVGISGPDIPKIVGQYYGNCGVKVPLSMVSHDALVGAAINAVVGGAATLAKNGITVGSAAASGNEADLMDTIGSAANSTVNWASNTAVNVINGMKPETTVIGAAGMSAGMMSKQIPFIIKTIPIQSLPDDFRILHGYMTNRSGKLSDFSGYCEVEQIQLNNIPAYEEELKEILALLKGGVII
jgi:hypothetical protein